LAAGLNKISRENLTERVYQRIKEALMTGHFKPGERLAIRPLAEQIGTSLTPVREALLRLIHAGALEMKPAHPISVPVLTRERYLENRTIRVVNEGLAAAEAAKKISKSQLQGIRKIHQAMAGAFDQGRYSKVLVENQSFHLALCNASGMPSLVSIIEILWLQVGPSLNYLYSRGDVTTRPPRTNYHEQVIKALEERDSKAARIAIEKDLTHGGAPLLAYFEGQGADSPSAERSCRL
jgi:DNA-binding GntR family transcriptional regulator